ncbi:unnamed protein product [Leuciscus chuanchicus]
MNSLFHTILMRSGRPGGHPADRWSDSFILPSEQARVPHPTHAHTVGGRVCSTLQRAGADGLFSKQPCVVLRYGNNLISREAEREKPVFSKAKHKQSFISTAALILT